MFKNLCLFRGDSTVLAKLLPDLEAQLAAMPLKAIGPQEMSTAGFLPFVHGTSAHVLIANGMSFINVGVEKRVLPPKAVEREVARRIAAVEEKSGERLRPKARRQLSQEVHLELLPRALTVVDRLQAFIDPQSGYCGVATSSRKTAEFVVSLIRTALGSFPVERLAPTTAPTVTLTTWLRDNALPEGFIFGGEVLLKDDGAGSTIRATKEEIAAPEFLAHLQSGKYVSRLALFKHDNAALVVGDDLVLRKLAFVIKEDDGASPGAQAEPSEQATAIDATAWILSAQLRTLFADLAPLLGPPLVTPQPQLQRPLQLTLDVPEAA
jgi:recombination associated protein RdgC